MIDTCLALQPLCQPKGLEIRVVTKAAREKPQPNPAFVFHFSLLYAESYARDPQGQLARMPGTDPDLIAHFSMVRSSGRALLGGPAKQVFAPILRLWLLDGIQGDMADTTRNMKDQPVYYILMYWIFGHALAFLEDDQLLSKQEGEEWGCGICLWNTGRWWKPLWRPMPEALLWISGNILSASLLPKCGTVGSREEQTLRPEILLEIKKT